ncbi:MAG: histidine kinase [Chloroflexi bacterium HGW-Chloroflexi-8]|nr:MAG: histidine kinase [Chloroflexi bacterium HGW-Chloroflexi-8]
MNTVKDILDQKGKNVWSVGPQDTLLDALKMFRAHGIGSLLVIEQGNIKGIITERDFAWQIADKGLCPLNQPVSMWMTSDVIVVSPDMSINECMQLMSREHVRHLPVVDRGKLSGMISIGDVVKAVISGQQSTILGLENYILSQKFAL